MVKRFFLGIFIVLVCASFAHGEMVSIKGKKVNMRSGPGKKYSVLWELGSGFPLMIKETRGNWIKVSDFEGDTGWIYKKLASKKPHLIVKKKMVNIRSGPGEKYKIVGKANYGVVLRTLKRGKGWVKVKHENGLTGWVQRSLVWGW